jgi:hypothetical protein
MDPPIEKDISFGLSSVRRAVKAPLACARHYKAATPPENRLRLL